MTNSPQSYSVMMATAADEAEAMRLASLLVEGQHAACVQIMPIHSVYMWKGKVESAGERMLFVKTRTDKVDRAISAIRSAHSYETPEIISLPMNAGLLEYLQWIDDVTTPTGG